MMAMSMSFWNENLLGDDWSMELPLHQESGLFDDLKPSIYDDINLSSFPFQGDLDCSVSNGTGTEDDSNLDSEWMESSDLAAYIDDFNNGESSLVPLDSSLHELTFLFPADEESKAVSKNGSEQIAESFDALASPSSSPPQVAPINILVDVPVESDFSLDLLDDTTLHSHSLSSDLNQTLTLDNLSFEQDTFLSVGEVDDFVQLNDRIELGNFSLPSQDADSVIPVPNPVSAVVSNKPSIIESSPELYKVISNLSSTTISPYSKKRPAKIAKEPKKRPPAEPIPEHVISCQANKKDRKKMQNKNAAIKYRQKKKVEAMGIKSEEQVLEEYNTKLRADVEDLLREIKYMKGLMEDINKAKIQS